MLTFNTSPYFDDFDKNNKFYRVLYKPSLAVQGRELTQSQSILQEQIKKFGDHIFKHGAMVIPGQILLDKDTSYQKMVTVYGGNNIDIINFIGYTLVGDSSGVEADVVNASNDDGTDPLTFFLKFKNSGDDNESIGFWDGEDVYRKDDAQIRATVEGILNIVTPTYVSNGKSSMASIGEGIYYVNGIFVDNDSQSIIVSKYDQLPTCKVGLRIYETVVTSNDDISLNDNAQGSPNYAAPGADRYKIDLKLEYVDIDDDISDDFIILQYLRQGEVVKEIRVSAYSELEKTFARRTKDESGDYTVNPFSIIMKEHLRDEADSQYEEGTFFNPYGDSTKLVAEMGAGKAYVQGYEISNISKTNVEINKARDYTDANNSVTNFSLGNYIEVDNVHNNPRIDEFGVIYMYDAISTAGTQGAGNEVGTARIRSIKRFGDISYLYLFDISMNAGYNFEDDVKWIYDTNGTGNNNFTCEAVEDIDNNNKVYLNKVNNNVLLFNIPNSTIKTLSVGGGSINTSYLSSRGYFNVGVASNIATLVAGDNEVFQQNTSEYYVADITTGVQYDNSTLTFTFTGSLDGSVLEIGNLTGNINVITPLNKSVSTQKTKNLQTTGSIEISSPNKIQNQKDSLEKADVILLKNVYMSGDFDTTPLVTDTDITDRYVLDTGQRDNYYDVASIVLKAGQSAPTGRILCTFNHFTHTTGDYFSVDSYVDIDFDDSQIYISNESGETYNLFDCFDFRPVMSDDGNGFTGVGASIGELPQVFSDISSDYEYYLNRIDYIYLDYRGGFTVAEGIPAVYPNPPEKPVMGMVLYEVYLPAYTFKPDHASPAYKDNKRYTMSDIGDLDKRIGNLEYYTTLSLLERETSSMEILDQNGLNRFKNGFIVDPFDSHKVGDSTHSDYNCAIDPKRRRMRPKFNDENIGLLFDADNSTNVQRTGGLITLPYSDVGINKQSQSSKYENINPFAFRNIFGEISFNPDSDVWHDKTTLPTLVVNHSPNYEALKFIADNTGDLNGVEWGRWSDVGGEKKTGSSTSTKVTREYAHANWTPESHQINSLKINTNNTTTTTFAQKQTMSGIATEHKDSNVISESLGDRITEVNYIPYMRSINVLIKSSQMKKNTKVYPFFDDISMSSLCVPASTNEYCTPASKIYFSSITGEFKTSDHGEENLRLSTNSSGSIKVLFQTDTYVVVVNMEEGSVSAGEIYVGMDSGATLTVSSVEYNTLGDPLLTGDYGEIALIWRVPNDSVLKFMTGEREFVLNDQNSNADPVHTKAKGMFKSHGMSSKQEDTVLSTKTITFSKNNVKQNRTLTRKESITNSSTTGWIDPLAQSFLITEYGGCFLTKVRLWFQNKDSDESVVCQIRNMVNGYPSEIIMAETTLRPQLVNVSETSPDTPTDFVFPEPVYLKEDEDYCFVLMPSVSSASYNVWVAENGKLDTNTGEVITGKESLGSLFKSQNASTWTPDQNEDIMFELFKAQFDIGTDGNCVMVNDMIYPELLSTNPIETLNASTIIRIYHNDHGMTVNSIYNISGFDDITSYNGILGSQLNGEVTVIDVEIDSFTFNAPATSNKSGLTGGNGIYGTRNYQLDTAHPLVNELIIDETKIDWLLQTTTGTSVSGTSVSGSQTPYVTEPYINVINNEDIFMDSPMIIASPYNETAHLSGDKSLNMIGVLHSNNENVSPVVDASLYHADTLGTDVDYVGTSSSTFISISNRIDLPSITPITVGTDNIFEVVDGGDEFIINQSDHGIGTGSYISISGFTDIINTIAGTFDPNGINEVRIIDKDSYLIDMDSSATSAYVLGDGGGGVTLSYSDSHYIYVPETKNFNCSSSSRYITKQVTLQDPAENFKLFFAAVKEQYADIDIYYKLRGPYEVTEWNDIEWVLLDTPDDTIPLSQSISDFKDHTYTIEDLDQFNTIAIKIVMTSTDSTQVPIFADLRLICTT